MEDILIMSEDGKSLLGVIDKSICDVVIPLGTEYIGDNAFIGCSSLMSVDIPNSVVSIGNSTFWGCTSLKYIDLPDSVISIGNSAFNGCAFLESIDIPISIAIIGDLAFGGCSSLKHINIPDSVSSIGDCVFENCTSLESINVSADNVNYASRDGVLFTKDYKHIIKVPPQNKITNFHIPECVISLYKGALCDCTNLKIIEFPTNIKSICGIDFRGCSSLECINVSLSNPSYVSVDGVLFSRDLSTIIKVPGGISLQEFQIPESVYFIENGAFNGCRGLKGIIISNNVEYIGDDFDNCSSLEYITVASDNLNFASVDGVLFSKDLGCLIRLPIGKSLTEYNIPKTVSRIDDNAFSNCIEIKSINISNGLTDIESFAFSNCSSLECIKIPQGVMSLGTGAFLSCSSLKDIYIPNSVTYIGISAFCGCTSLEHIAIPLGVTQIAECTFSGCASLKSIEIPKNISEILSYAFHGCLSLKSISIPQSVRIIDNFAFLECNSLDNIHFRHNKIDECEITMDSLNGVNSKTCTLFVPSGSRWAYRHHSVFSRFHNIETEKF